MPTWLLLLHFFALAIEALGVFLLFQEVLIAHKYEEMESGLMKIERPLNAIGRGDWYQANLEILLDTYSLDQTLLLLQGKSSSACQADALHWKQSLPAGVNNSLARWYQVTHETQFAARRRKLLLGVCCVIAALLLEGTLVVLENLKEREPVHISIVKNPRQRLVKLASNLTFDEAEASLAYTHKGQRVDLSHAACAIKIALQNLKPAGVIVIGRFDQRSLQKPDRLRFSSNLGLAQRRADVVSLYLAQNNECGKGLDTIIPLIAAPSYVGVANRSSPHLGEDRTIGVYALR